MPPTDARGNLSSGCVALATARRRHAAFTRKGLARELGCASPFSHMSRYGAPMGTSGR